ncbi:DNA-dependent protein kinase catalytic subunit-like [Hylaeus volcanicus]|uniref:DNA-dependent protein kinase catalytic subunit-like n=1 Tax=Hylaeus volcanicus TaxID=313075 RepID=UPI0023B7B1A6|nr:DNA-dependent protein kinase catalytic subunit-like [Hylaeus volcanicus]
MDSFETFMDIFERTIKERNSSYLTETLKNRTYFQHISKTDSELVLSILFNKEKGLLCFINNELGRSIPQKGFDRAIKEAFDLLEFIMCQFSDIFEPYIIDAKNTCQQALVTRCTSFIQKAACSAFSKLIELFKEYETELDETITKFVSLFHLMDIKERSLLLSILGKIAQHNPDIPEIQEYSNMIFQQLHNDFKKQYNSSQSNDIFQIYFDTYSNILDVLSSEEKEKYHEELYKWIKDLSRPEKYNIKKVTLRSAVYLLSHHIVLFRDFVYRDHEYWYELLTKLVKEKNVDCSKCGQHALMSFYQLIGKTLTDKTSEDDRAVFLYFKNIFDKQLNNNEQTNSEMLRLIVYGFSQMAAPCKRYLTNKDVTDMFTLITHCAMPLCFRDDLQQSHLESICNYQEALSEIILHTSDLSINQLNVILKLSILLVKRFPDLPIIGRNPAITSLINTIINVGIVSRNLLQEFLYNLIQEGIIWSCSHTLLVDAELQRGLNNLEDLPTCYKNYLPLWTQLLKPNMYKEHREVAQEVVDATMHVCIILISKLNLNTKTKEDNVYSDAAFSQIADNEEDFRIFVNIVDLYVDIINKLESSMLTNVIHKFLLKIISMSYKHPLISGFNKLVHATFKHISTFTKDEIETDIVELLYKYLINVLNLVSSFSNELLTTCLLLILDTPKMYIEYILDSTIPVFRIAFIVGLSDFEVACTALNALKSWTSHLDNQRTNKFLREVVPFLVPYLHSEESSVEFLQDIIKTKPKVIKHILQRDDENTLETFQRKVLLFIASLDTDIIQNFVYKRSMDIGATWDKKDLLKYTLPNMEVNIYFDKILSRLILLAQHSGDRRTKIIACEALHSVTAFLLGKMSQHFSSDPDKFVPICMTLCPALFSLGCDHDEAARKIFQPLVLQLTHWLSSEFMIKSLATTNFLDSLFESLCDDSNSSVREFSGMCLAEFTKWSIKQTNTNAKIQQNISDVIYKMINLALHPSTSKRVAAATAFNHLYTILRENEEIVSIHWLEILYSFVKSLDGCNNLSIITALDHVERVLIAKRNLLNLKYHVRKKPPEFEGSTLTHAIHWLLIQCGCIDQCCRAKCMELVLKLSEHITNCDSAETMINNYIDIYGIEHFNRILLKDLNIKLESLSYNNILPLLRSLDCYIWLIRNNLINVQLLFASSNSEREVIFNCTRNFIHLMNKIKIETKKDDFIMLSKELEDLQTLRCKLIITMFDCLQILLNFDDNLIPAFLFTQDLFQLISKCIMCPQVIGFDMKNLEITEALPLVMGNLLQAIMKKPDDSLLCRVKQELSAHVEKHINSFIDLDKILFDTDTCSKLKQYIRGLNFLEQHNILHQLPNATQLIEQPEDKVTRIFKALAKEQIGELVCVNIKPLVKDYLQIFMELLLMHYKPSMTKTLIELIETNTMLEQGFTKVEHGIYFLNIFANEIFQYMLKDTEKTMQVFDHVLRKNPTLLLTITEQLFLFVKQRKKELHNYTEILVDAAIKRFTMFERAVNNLEPRKQKLISIYGIAVHLKEKPTEAVSLNNDFYTWILSQLTTNSDLEYKIQILQNFLICLTGMTSNTELFVILSTLQSGKSAVCPNDFLQKNVKALKIINCFQTLLTLLPVTKSMAVFKSVILFAAGIAEHLCNETTNEYLQKYCISITTEYALESIEAAYKLFMNLNAELNERFDILRTFLLPLFEFCRITEIRRFFEKNIREIYTTIDQGLIGNNSDMKQLIVSKIGCYELIAKLFAKIPMNEINDTESVIVRNAIDDVKTGKEFVQSLYSSVLNVRMLKTSEAEHKEIMRLLHCSAYNCSIAIVALKEDEISYVSVTFENKNKGQLIWENIVDCQKKYNLQQTFKEYPKHRKKLINIRKSMKQKQNPGRYSYIYSYDLSTCTLNEDINAYDFNEMVVHSTPNYTNKEESMSLLFEIDELNNHECMESICGVLSHMISEDISTPPTDDDIVIPLWLKYFCNSMMSTNYDNVRLFMLKIVLNMQTVFKPYKKIFLQPIIHATYSYLKMNQLNYVITDVIEMLIEWQVVNFSDETNGKAMIQKLWEMIIGKTIPKANEISKTVYKYNMTLIKTMLEMWQTCLKLPINLNDRMRTAPEGAVYLILICIVNGMIKDIVQRNDIIGFLEKSLERWQDNEETVLQCCECFSFIMKFMDDENDQTSRRSGIIEKIQSILRQMQTTFKNRLIKCILALCKSYPNAGIIYFDFITANIFRVDSLGKLDCLEIFLLCIPKLNADKILQELDYIKFPDLLKNKILSCEKIALQIIDSLVLILPPSNLSPLANLAIPYAKHESSEYRECTYNIFMNIYKKYAVDTSEDKDIRELMHSSKKILLNGVLDLADQLTEKVVTFWTQDAQLTRACTERLLETLNMYTPDAGNTFLPFVLLMIFDLTKKSKRYTHKMFEPLHNCNYRDYNISLSWRTKNLGSKAPLFAPSLASQMNQTLTQASVTLPSTSFNYMNMRQSFNSTAEFQLRATQDLEFEATYINQEPLLTLNDLEHDDTFKIPKVPQPAYNKKSKRLLSSSTEISAAIRQKEIKKKIQRNEMIKEEVARQRSSVKLYRKYRVGDFPDIEISHSMLIEPLQQLAKKDQLICKDLIVSIVCSLLEEYDQHDFVKKVTDSLKHIIENQHGNNSAMGAILEILLTTRITDCPPEVISKVSRLNNLNFLGSFVVEENLIHGTNDTEPPRKKARNENISDSRNEWLQLTNLYKSMNDVDVVLSIFRNHIEDEDIREASLAQADNNWVKAKAAYEKAYETDVELVKEHCLQGLFESLSNLCYWNEVDEHIQKKLNRNLNNIWEDPWKDWMFSWLFEAHVRRFLNGDFNDAFQDNVKVFETWLNDEVKVKYIKRFFGEELSIFFLPDKLEAARDFLVNTLDQMREQWIRIHPLSTQLRTHGLQKLRIINEIYKFIEILKTAENPSDLKEVLKFWNNNVPSVQDSILIWDKLTSYRIHFIDYPLNNKLEQWNLNETQNESESLTAGNGTEIIHQMRMATFNMRLKIIEAALNQKNKHIAQKYVCQMEQNLGSYSVHMKHQFLLTVAKLKYLNGETASNVKKKMSNYTFSWKQCHDLLEQTGLDPTTNVDVRWKISKVASKIADLSEENETFSELLTRNATILSAINAENNDLTAIRDTLKNYGFNHLKKCCETTTTNIKKCYFMLSKYCYDRLSRGNGNTQLSKEFVKSTLKAMIYGSLEAVHYFPCLLKPEYFEDEETRNIFLNESVGVQTWLFLSWQAQLFSHLGTSIAPLIIPILKRIVETYPNAVIYTLRLTVETNPTLLNDARTYEIRQILYNRPEIERFLMAMEYVVKPELYLRYYLLEFLKNLSQGTCTAVDMLLKKVYPSSRENKNNPLPGSIFSKIAIYKSKIKELENRTPSNIKQIVKQMIETIKDADTSKGKVTLQNYSPWLQQFCERDIEIPGQYVGDRKPMPQYHTKIIKFEPNIKVMPSLRKPIRITMVGNDAKEYHFLVKFGEDLRQDQRLQQLFTIMNKTLHIDTACKQRQLFIDTYQVIPLSKTVGLIQWIENTRSLEELIHFTLSKEERAQYNSIYSQFKEWIRVAAPFKNEHERYKMATIKYSASKVIAKMTEFISKTQWDGLRRTLMVLCPSIESFVTMRRNFITSYSTMCIAHWILGIGDRHLGNTVIIIDSGRCLGIDFGLAFGAGIDQKIPELIPFRLTSQILGLLKPFNEKDLLGAVMTHTLRALRNEPGPILSCMDVFVHEPLNWTEHVNKELKDKDIDIDIEDVKWVPRQKIKVVMKKFDGVKPSLITLEQLKEQHNDEYFDRYYSIVTGDDDIKRTRTRIGNSNLIPEQQVECLLDEATDLNIIGRSYEGWKPWL